MNRCVIALWALFFWLSIKLSGQENISYTKYTSDNGLPANVIQKVIQDRKGFIWIATGAGLSRFDGYEFKNYNTSDSYAIGLNCRNINNLIEDKEGNIWITASPCGIFIYNRKEENFQSFKQFTGLDYKNEIPIYTNILESDDKGNIFISATDTLIIYNLYSKKIIKYSNENFKVGQGITDIKKDKNYNLWLQVNDQSLYKFQVNEYKLTSIYESELQKKINLCMSFVGQGNTMWEIINNEELYEIDIKTNKIKLVFDASKTGSLILFGSDEGNNKLWLFMDNGIIIFDKKFNTKTYLNKNNLDFIGGYYFNTIKDKQQQLWLATVHGLYKINTKNNFRQLNFINNTNIPASKYVDGFLYAEHGKVIIGKDYNLIVADKNLNVNKIESFKNGAFILRNRDMKNNDIFLVDRENNYFISDTLFRVKEKLLLDVKYQWEITILNRENNTIWAFGDKIIEYSLNLKKQTVHSIEEPGSYIMNNYKIENKGYWVCGNFEGIKFFDTTLKKITKTIKLNKERKHKIQVTDFCKLDNDNVFVGSEDGLYKVNLNTSDVIKYDIYENGKSMYVNSILKDNHDNLWLGTAEGIAKFNLKSLKHTLYTTSDGICQNENNIYPMFHPIRKEFWFGGINGITIFNPDSIKENTIVPDIEFTEIKYFNTNNKSDLPHYIKAPELQTSLTFCHTENIIEFKFAALNYISTEKNQYKYRLTGFHDNWVSIGTKREITFTNLSPGNYTLQVIGSNNDGVWNEIGKSISITIKPPIWATIWAKVLYILLLFAGIYSLIKWRSSQLKKENVLLENKVNERTLYIKQIQDKLIETEKLALLGEVSRGLHDDIGTTLSKINLHSYMAQTKLEKNKEEHNVIQTLANIQSSAQEMVNKLKDLLWSINPESENIENLFEKIHQYAGTMAESKNMILNFKSDKEINKLILTVTEKYNLYLISKEAINNAVKHSNAKTLNLSIEYKNKKLNITLADDGLGFDEDNVGIGYGLENMKKRAGIINAVLEIKSTRELGTILKLSLPVILT